MRRENANSEAVATPSRGVARPERPNGRADEPRPVWHQYEGQLVSIVLVDGTLLRACVLVSAGRGRVQTVWVLMEDTDVFIPHPDVAEIWLGAASSRNQAA